MLFLAEYFHSFFNNFAYLLETVLDESFWQLVLGQRWFGLVKRYIGNDAVMFGIFLSLGRKYSYDEWQHTHGVEYSHFSILSNHLVAFQLLLQLDQKFLWRLVPCIDRDYFKAGHL